MIDKTKYLYWLDANNPNVEQEIVYREMYSRIGCILHIFQMVEYNIANILSVEEFEKINGRIVSEEDIEQLKEDIKHKYKQMTKMMFGDLQKEIKKSKYLANIELDALKNIGKYRNYLVHNCFKEKLIDNKSSLEDVDKFVDDLNDFEALISDFNNQLVKIFEAHKIKRVCVIKNEPLF